MAFQPTDLPSEGLIKVTEKFCRPDRSARKEHAFFQVWLNCHWIKAFALCIAYHGFKFFQ